MSGPATRRDGRSSLLRRVWEAVRRESTPLPSPRPRPSKEQLAEGQLSIGVIDAAIEDGPGADVQGADMLMISAEIPGQETLRRRVLCPLSMPGSGRGLVGQSVGFRHTTVDPDFTDDVLVVRWPNEVNRALAPVRFVGPGSLRARAWSVLRGCCVVATCGGIMLTPVLLSGMIFSGGEMFADLPAWFHPGAALAASVGAAVLGVLAFAVCDRRMNAALEEQHEPADPN